MDLRQFIQVARGAQPADLLLTNAQIVDLYNLDIVRGQVAIADGRIAGTVPDGAPSYRASEVVDLQGQYVAPGFIDGHVHIESSMVSIPEFARAVVPGGVTTVITDPHEIANVLGMTGVRYMLEVAKWNPLSVFVMASSGVPAGPFESAGAKLSAYDLENLMHDKWVLGLAEMMDYPGVLSGDPEALAKIDAAGTRPLDGHAPGIEGMELNAYAAAGIGSDHESTTPEEALDRIRRGMVVMIREATPARNLKDLLPLVTVKNARRFLFVTDDRNPLHLLEDGSVDGMVRQAIALGLDPLLALQLASLNAAEYFRLYDRGSVTPGKRADLIVFKDLRAPRATLVYRGGRLVARNGDLLPYSRPAESPTLPVSLSVPRASLRFGIPAQGKRVRVIDIIPNQILTKAGIADARVDNGRAVADPDRDLLKIALIERHTGSGRVGVGFVRGFGLGFGALASTVAHDAHNIIVVGADDESMRSAVEVILDMRGGLVAVAGREVVKLPLPIAGLMSDQPIRSVAEQLRALLQMARRMGSTLEDPFMTLSFLALSVIPALKITDRGLLDVTLQRLVPLFVDES
jgi:adenine deaminase